LQINISNAIRVVSAKNASQIETHFCFSLLLLMVIMRYWQMLCMFRQQLRCQFLLCVAFQDHYRI